MDISFLLALLFLQCFQESVVCHGVHMCEAVKVLEKPSEDQNENMTLIKFGFISLSSSCNITQASTLAAGQVTTNNNESAIIGAENGSSVDASTTSSTTPSTTPSRTPSPKECQNVTTVDKMCNCEIHSKTNFTINILKVLEEKNFQSPPVVYWTIDESSTCEYLNSTSKTPKEVWNRKIGIFVEESASECSYSITVEVKGDSFDVVCTGTDTGMQVPDTGRLSASYELVLNNVLLIVGAILAVIGILLISTAIVVYRRYRKKHKKRPDELEMKEMQCNYEEISTDSYEHTHVSFQDEIDLDFLDQGTESSTSRKMSKQEQSSRFRSASLQGVAISDKHPLRKTPSPKKGRLKKLKLTEKKQKHRKGSAEKEQKSSSTDSDSDVTYSSVQIEYEVLQEQHHSSKTHDLKVATPLLLVHNNAEVRPLRKTDHLKELQNKAKIMPKMELPDKIVTLQNHNKRDENTYSHLNRAEKSQSCHMNSEALYDDSKSVPSSNNNACSKTSDVVTGRKNVFKFHILKPVSPKSTNMSEGPARDGMGISVGITQEEQEHIYEPMEKEDTAETEASQPQDRESCAQENPENDATNSGDLASKENSTETTRDAFNQPSSKTEDDLYETVSDHNEDAPECDMSDDDDDEDVIVKRVNSNSVVTDSVNTKGKQNVMGETAATKSQGVEMSRKSSTFNDSLSTTPMTMVVHSGVLVRQDHNRNVKITNRSSRDIDKAAHRNGRHAVEAASRNSIDIDKTACRSSRDIDRSSRDIDRSSRDIDKSSGDIVEIANKKSRDIDKTTGYNNIFIKSANCDNNDESNCDHPMAAAVTNQADKLQPTDPNGPIPGPLSDSHARINTKETEEKEGEDKKDEEKGEEKEDNAVAVVDYDHDKFTIIENILYEPLPLCPLSQTLDG